MSQPRSLLDLYKLLWEQIKDEDLLTGLCRILSEMWIELKISTYEFNIMRKHFKEKLPKGRYGTDKWLCWKLSQEGTQQRKEFLQRMIKELEDGK